MTDDAELLAQVAVLTEKVEGIHEDVTGMKGDIKQLTAQANRWKGAFVVLLAIGSLIGWFADKATGMFK